MAIYELKFHNNTVLTIDKENGRVEIFDESHIPFDLFLSESDSFNIRVYNVSNFNSWCANRVLNLDRKYAKEILNYFGFSQNMTDLEKSEIAIETRCLSLNDGFWLKSTEEQVKWEDVNLFDNSLENAIFEVALLGKSLTLSNTELTTPDLATDGTAAKAWRRTGDIFYLLKADTNDSAAREVEASCILKELGFDVVGYEYNNFDNTKVSECLCFTSKEVNLVRAGRYKNWCDKNNKYFIDILKRFEYEYDMMNLSDYLIGNSDEHPDNWGFLYDNDMNITSFAPLMDYDRAFLSSRTTICSPALLTRGRISQEQVAKEIILKYPSLLNFDIKLDNYKYGKYVEERLAILKQYLNVEKKKNKVR